VRLVLPLTPFMVAEIVAVPVPVAAADPELLTAAIAKFDEVQATPTSG